jgi:hypothetical protein
MKDRSCPWVVSESGVTPELQALRPRPSKILLDGERWFRSLALYSPGLIIRDRSSTSSMLFGLSLACRSRLPFIAPTRLSN